MIVLITGTIASSLYVFRKDLILSLIDRGYTVHAFTSDSDKAELAKIAQLGAIPTHYKLSRGGLNPYEDLSNTIGLYQKIKKIQPDIVLSYFIKPAIYGTLAAKIAKVPKKIAMIEGLSFAFIKQVKVFSKKPKAKALSLTDEQILSNNIRARKRIEELFSLEKSVEKWLEIYEAK